MVQYPIPAAEVVDALGVPRIAHEEIQSGQWVYLDRANNERARLAHNAAQDAANVYGLALNTAYPDQPVNIITGGLATVGTILSAGAMLVISATPGIMMDAADSAPGQWVTFLGFGRSGTVMDIRISASGVQKA